MPTYEEMQEWRKKYKKEREEFNKKLEAIRLKELEEKGLKPFDESSIPPKQCDHPNTMENSTATVLWIIVMIVGALFRGRLLVWIVATLVWLSFITRHSRNK